MRIRQHGFNIIEMMVGLTIGLLGLLAVTQVMITFNKQRNSTVQTMEAQSNGTMALFLIERDLNQAGYALTYISNCSQIEWYWNPAPIPPSAVPPCSPCGLQTPLTTFPVLITPGATATASDTINIQYGRPSSGSPGAVISLAPLNGLYTDDFRVASTAGFNVGDMVVTNVTNACTMSRVTKVNDDTNPDNTKKFTLEHTSGTTTNTAYNPAGAAPSGTGWQPALLNSFLVNLGSYVSRKYSIAASGDTLQRGEFPTYVTDSIADGIVYMRAQYGMDTDNDGAVDIWRDGNFVINAANSNTVVAVRIGLIARSPLYEKDAVMDSAGNPITSLTVMPAILNSGGVTIGTQINYALPDTHYRYKPYYTIIPLRNLLWLYSSPFGT